MKNLIYFLFIFTLLSFLSCNEEEIGNINNTEKSGIPASVKQKIRTEASKDELANLNGLFTSGQVKVKDGTLHFKDGKSFIDFNNLINLLNIDQLIDFEKNQRYSSFYVDKYVKAENVGFEELYNSKPHLFIKSDKIINSILVHEKLCNTDGFYYFKEDIVFNSSKVNISEFRNVSVEKFNTSVKLYLIQGIKDDKLDYLEIDKDRVESRVCGWQETTIRRDYTVGGDTKWFRATVGTFLSSNPIRNQFGQVTGWEWFHGWKHNITNFRVYWLYTTTSSGPLYIKTDAYVQGNPDFQWEWQTCGSCHDISHSAITNSGTVAGNIPSLIPVAPRFNPLIWFIAKVEEGSASTNGSCGAEHGADPVVCTNCY